MKITHVYKPEAIQLVGVTFTKEAEALIRANLEGGNVVEAQKNILLVLPGWKAKAYHIWRQSFYNTLRFNQIGRHKCYPQT